MSEPTIELERMPTREDRMLVEQFAGEPCACTEEQQETTGKPEERPASAEQVLCRPCAARQILNGMVTFAEEV